MVGQTSRMQSALLITLFLLFSLCLSMGVQADFSASVNRTTISSHESLELTLQTNESSDEAPDLSPLEWSFDVLGTRQHSQTSWTNGRKEYSRKWIITLIPKQEGTLVIPPITLGDQQSEPISITVTGQGTQDDSLDNSPLFMKAEVNHDDVFIQQELLLTVQIFYSIQLYDDNRLTNLDLGDALVQQLGETRKFDRIINGIRYQGFELKYSIHPQSAGELVIPSMKFTGTAAETRDPFGSFFSRSGKPVVARSPELRVNVKPQPDTYPTTDAWLPARDLTIQEQWSQPLDSLKVGDAITRTITVNADGLSTAQLPPILMPHPEGVNSYPDKSSTGDMETVNGIRGQRTDSIAMIPTQPGVVTLPAIEYIWFDTESGAIKTSSLPETRITVAEGGQLVTPTVTQVPAQPTVVESQPVECPEPKQPATPESNDSKVLLWQVVSGVLALLWIITLYLFWRARNSSVSSVSSEQPERNQSKVVSEELASFKRLEAACMDDDGVAAFNELKSWSRLYLENDQLISLTENLKQLGSTKLESICSEFSASRYSADHKTVDSKDLLAELLMECRKIREHKAQAKTAPPLGKLYPQ